METEQITVRIAKDIVTKLRADAKAERRSLAKQVEYELAQAQAQKPAKGMFDG